MVQDEVSRPALRQTVMTTNCGDTNQTDVKTKTVPPPVLYITYIVYIFILHTVQNYFTEIWWDLAQTPEPFNPAETLTVKKIGALTV